MRSMIKKIALLMASLAVLCGVAMPTVAYAVPGADDVFEKVCQDPEAKKTSTCASGSSDPIAGPDGIITKFARIVAWITGIVAVIMIIGAGFMFITSGGDANKIKEAKNMITYAAVGIAVVVLAQIIVAFIISRV